MDGHTGLLRTPIAGVVPNGQFVLTGSGIQGEHLSDEEKRIYDSYSTRAGISVGFAKNLELNVRVSFYPVYTPLRYRPRWDFSGDRAVGFQYQVLQESGGRPGVVVGAMDFAGTRLTEAEYVVAGKTLGRLRCDMGIGANRLAGIFGGISYRAAPNATGMLEWDTEHLNVGLEYRPTPRLSAKAALLGLDSGAFAVSYSGGL